MVTVATWNVNSVRSRLAHLLGWLKEDAPDIVLLQELKCVDEAFPAMEIEELGYNLALFGQKTYNGVAILSKFPLEDVRRGLCVWDTKEARAQPEGRASHEPASCRRHADDIERLASGTTLRPIAASREAAGGNAEDARYVEAVVSVKGGAMRVASVYVPNGQEVGSEKYAYKMRFYDRLRAHLTSLLHLNETAIVGGDFNVAPEEIDVYDPKAWGEGILFSAKERAQLRSLLHLGYYDAFRTLHPDTTQYSWWDYRGGAYEKNAGLRIDHLLLSPLAVDRLESCEVAEKLRTLDKPSDHAPVVCTLAG